MDTDNNGCFVDGRIAVLESIISDIENGNIMCQSNIDITKAIYKITKILISILTERSLR